MKDNQIQSHSNISRRDVVKSAIAVTAAVASGAVLAEDDHKDHEHHGHAVNPNLSIADSAMDCVKTGQLCIEHCMQLFRQGDTTLVECADLGLELLAMCGALAQMVSYQSKHLGAVAKVCISVCKDCEDECRKHEDKHVECKECADACAACIKECEKVVA